MPAPDNHVADQGVHEFTYSLYAHSGDWRAGNTMRQGYELNYPLIALRPKRTPARLPAKHAFARIEPGNVILTVMKKAEDDDGVIFRFYEFEGKTAQVKLDLPEKAARATEANLMEKRERADPACRRWPQPHARSQALRDPHGRSHVRAGKIRCPSARATSSVIPRWWTSRSSPASRP